MKILIHWFVYTVAIMLSAYLLSGVHVSSFITALIVALVLGAINGVLKPILVVLTLPITILTLGLFLLVLNTLLIMLAAYIVPGFSIDGFWWAFLFGIVLTMVNYILNKAFKKETPEA